MQPCGLLLSDEIHWVKWGTGTPKGRDEVNKPLALCVFIVTDKSTTIRGEGKRCRCYER